MRHNVKVPNRVVLLGILGGGLPPDYQILTLFQTKTVIFLCSSLKTELIITKLIITTSGVYYSWQRVSCFFITIFRLAIPAFFRFTDVTQSMIRIKILRNDGECRNDNCLKGRGGNEVQHKKKRKTKKQYTLLGSALQYSFDFSFFCS